MRGATVSVEMKLFGRAAITAGGTPVKLPKRSTALSLLGYLILNRDAAVSRASLAYTLFPDETEEAALAELRRYLYLTAKALPPLDGDAWIHTSGETVRWNVAAPCRVDVIDFERQARADATRADAVARYTGDLLEEIYDDWVAFERERLRGICLDALAQLVARHREAREHTRAAAYAQQLLRLDPWREDIVRALMSVRYQAGDSAGALAEYEHFARDLRHELRAEPMPETTAVREAIVRGEALPGDLVTREQRSAKPARAAPLLPFIGRKAELPALRIAWSRAARGNGALVLIEGEAGVGKTRLIAELASAVEAEGGCVFAGGTSSPESMPYQPLLEALRSALSLLVERKLNPSTLSILAKTLPELQIDSAADTAYVAALNPERESQLVLEALADAILSLSRPRPALIVFEDLHWAGSATFDALATLARRLVSHAILVVGTYRTEEAPPAHALRTALRALQSEQRATRLPLEPFAREEVAELAGQVEGLADADAAGVDRLYAFTEGNALFLNETIADSRERHGGSLPSSMAATSGISGVVALRIARLSEDARTVAETAAVCGRGCNLDVVREVVALTPAGLAEALNELLDRRILREASARSGIDYAFTHQLIAAAIYTQMEPDARVRRHGRIAHVMRSIYRERLGDLARELAVHFERGGLPDDAAPWCAVAARASAAVYATAEALALADKSLELERGRAARTSLLRLREELHGRLGDRSGQKHDIDALEAAGADDDAARFDVLRRRMLLARSLGETNEEHALVQRMTALARTTADVRVRAEAARHEAAHYVLVSRQADAVPPAEEALRLYEELGDVAAQVECLGLLVDASTNAGELEPARGFLESMRERASSQADRAVHARALTIAATAALSRLEFKETVELTRESLGIIESLGDRDAEASARGRIAATAAWLDDFKVAFDEFDRALALFTALDNKRGLATTLTNKALLTTRLGLFEEAARLIERSNSLLSVVRERRLMVANAVNHSFVRLHLGDAPEALRLATEGLALARSIEFPVYEGAALANLGNAERALGKLDAALEHMEAGMEIRRSVQSPADLADDLADLTLTYVEAGRTAQALAGARELERVMDESSAGPVWPHYVLWAAAQGFRAAGELERARAMAERAGRELARIAASIPDPEMRTAFLQIDVNRPILAAPLP